MKKGKWSEVDISLSYYANVFSFKAGFLDIVIYQTTRGEDKNWYLTCRAIRLASFSLKTTDIDKAKAKALNRVNQELRKASLYLPE